MDTTESTQDKKMPPLTVEIVNKLWNRTHDGNGKPDWSHLYEYYHDDVVFQDVIQRVEGKGPFIEMCDRLAERCSEMTMEIHDVAITGNIVFIQWTMGTAFRNTPMGYITGMSKFTIADDNRIIEQRDSFDIWGDIIKAFPGIGTGYRKIMHALFG